MKHNNDPLFVNPVLLHQAEQVCKRRLNNDPANLAILRSLAEIYRKMGETGEAAAVYGRIVHLDPQDQEAGYLQAVLAGKEWPIEPTGTRAAPFVMLREFLPRECHDALLPYLVSVRDQFVPVPANDTVYDPNIRETLSFNGEWEGKTRFGDRIMEILPRVMPRLHLPPLGRYWVEVQVRAFADGNFFAIHRDADPESGHADRMINYVYYVHKSPRPFTGGELLLFDSDIEARKFTRSSFTRVVPEDNSIVFFPPNFYHSVVPIRCPTKEFADSRFTINGHVHQYVQAVPEQEKLMPTR